ncbi:MAG: S8 family serine peptidase [Rubrivivax sp.]
MPSSALLARAAAAAFAALRPLPLLAALSALALLSAPPAADAAARTRAKAPSGKKTATTTTTTTTTSSTSSSSGGGSSTVENGARVGELLLKLDSGDRLPDLQLRYRLSLVSRMGARPIYRLKVSASDDPRKVAAAMALEAGVLVAEPNFMHAGPEAAKNNVWAIGSESAYVQQWAPQAMRLPEAWALSTGAGQRVAVLDTGVDRSHPLLAGRLLPGRDFVDRDDDPSEGGVPGDVAYGHGTHVAGLVALAAPGARIMPLRVLDSSGGADAWSLAEAMLYAVDPDGNPDTDDGAHVINLSLAGPSRTRLLDSVALLASCSTAAVPDPSTDTSDAGYEDDRRRCGGFGGAVVVAAAGNDGSASLKSYPAAEGAYGLLAVAASDADRRVASFSNSGNWIQVAAPGDGVTSSVPGGWGTWSGTSMAAPLASGAVALLRAMAPQLVAADLVRCVTRTTTKLDGASFGQIDARAALQAVGSRKLCR